MNSVLVTVPDTLGGALTLSVVDFFLSIAIIWGISGALYLMPLLNRLGTVTKERLTGGNPPHPGGTEPGERRR